VWLADVEIVALLHPTHTASNPAILTTIGAKSPAKAEKYSI
jgi:hypothetical protein